MYYLMLVRCKSYQATFIQLSETLMISDENATWKQYNRNTLYYEDISII